MEPKPPTKPTLDGLERKWADRWARSGVYRFDRTRPRVEVFSIDTPPPTVSGNLHLGHAFSYTQTDVIARFQREGYLTRHYRRRSGELWDAIIMGLRLD